jgi:hypothetical protein
MKSKGLLWAVILTFVYLIVLPFPIAIIACIITGAIIPWITDSGNQNKDNDVSK